MRVNVLGLGYVGCVSAVCLANSGHQVTGIDVDPLKVRLINEGRSPIVEPGLGKAVQEAVSSSRLTASSQTPPADVTLVCVGTPSRENGSLDLQYIRRVSESLGNWLGKSESYHVVNVRSTVLPGTIEQEVIPLLEKHSGKKAGTDFGVCMNPEFMREGSSLKDYYDPPFTVIGEIDGRSGDLVASLYRDIEASLIRTPLRVAEMVKYVSNAFHALKVTFANEVGNVCKGLGIDSHQVMDVVCRDTKLNISPSYLMPGFAFGGSCLPKDLRALLHRARQIDLEPPLLQSILPSNRRQIEIAFRAIARTEKRRIGMLGLSFKPGSDDLRESPVVELVERLIGKGYQLSIFDREVSLARIFGANRRYIEQVIPHISSLLKPDLEEVLSQSEVLVVAKNSPEFAEPLSQGESGKVIIDLVRLSSEVARKNALYHGLSW
ncbi:MAG: UDP-glucose/GDP-mannose dehydrogenase family protein [Acidobacteriota bacterium]